MFFKKFGNIYIIRLKRGEEMVSSLEKLSEEEHIEFAWVSGLGAVSKITLGYYDLGTKEYFWKNFQGDLEISSLQGNISWQGEKPIIHVHTAIADEKQTSFGGHLKEAIAGGTIELRVETFGDRIEREKDEETGLNLLNF